MANIIIPTAYKMLNTTIKNGVIASIGDCTDNLLYVASQRSPYRGGTLEKSGTSRVTKSSARITGQVSFTATNKGFNYAEKMDKDRYKLGEKSLKKSSGGIKSKFSSETLKVGHGYLTDTAEKCETGYRDYIEQQIGAVITKLGL